MTDHTRDDDILPDGDRVEGALKKAGGSIKAGVGDMLGDRKMEAEGHAQKTEGDAQNMVGGAKDTARDMLDGKR